MVIDMASIMVHICVAKKINEYLKMPEKMLFLGAIAPDLSKEIDNSIIKSHFYDNSSNIQIDKFIDKYKYKMWYPYVMGYFIHLYADKLWDEKFIPSFIEKGDIKLKQGGMSLSSIEVVNKLIYEDCTNLAVTLIDKYEPKLSLFYDEVKFPEVIVDEIDTNKLDVLINKVSIMIANAKEEKPFIFDWDEVIKFIDDASIYIIDYIKKFDL